MGEVKMDNFDWKREVKSFDKRRELIIPGDADETVLFCARQFIQIGQESLAERNLLTVALSGGHTPNAIFKEISKPEYTDSLDWSKVFFFWSDERSVPPTHPESNYFNAMQSGLAKLPLPSQNIFRMPAEQDIEKGALAYEEMIKEKVPSLSFDMVMLGMGEDGHTASLFPRTVGLHNSSHLVIPNYIPQKHTWRMTLTYECIHKAKHICIYVIGPSKATAVATVFNNAYDPDNLPIQKVGTADHKALWIMDDAASEKLMKLQTIV